MKKYDIKQKDVLDKVSVLKLLAHPIRYSIVLALKEEGRLNVSQIQEMMSLPQSTVSQHITKMREAGILTPKREGTNIFYSINNELAHAIVDLLANY